MHVPEFQSQDRASKPLPLALSEITDALVRDLSGLAFAEPVTHVYNPLVYARRPHDAYLRRYAKESAKLLFLGMNPGPWGMVQTGVPFGEIAHVRDWLQIEEPIDQPAIVHPKRPIDGFACKRSEVSGRRLWGYFQDKFEAPDRFFERAFVVNYCPLVFMEEGGRNRVPEKLPAAEREPVLRACDRALRAMVAAIAPQLIVGVGKWAAERAKSALATPEEGTEDPHAAQLASIRVESILHPSPASPAANRGWAEQADAQLNAMGAWSL